MSYQQPSKLPKRTLNFYPAYTFMEDGTRICTGPYKKDIHGKKGENIKAHLTMILDEYDELKIEQINKIKDLIKASS